MSGLRLHPIIAGNSNHLVHSLLHCLLFLHLRTSKCHFSCSFLLIHYHRSFSIPLHEALTSFFYPLPSLLSCRWTIKIHHHLAEYLARPRLSANPQLEPNPPEPRPSSPSRACTKLLFPTALVYRRAFRITFCLGKPRIFSHKVRFSVQLLLRCLEGIRCMWVQLRFLRRWSACNITSSQHEAVLVRPWDVHITCRPYWASCGRLDSSLDCYDVLSVDPACGSLL